MDGEIKAEFDRVRDENTRQNNRISVLESDVRSFRDISLSVQKLALNMDMMLKEMTKQGNRLEALEQKPVESMEAARKTITNTFLGTLCGFVLSVIGALMLFGIKNL